MECIAQFEIMGNGYLAPSNKYIPFSDQGERDLWKKIWERKYDMSHNTVDKFQILNTPKGSTIWNLAYSNKNLIRYHSFWEIRGGNTTQFWEDSWQQREKLFSRLDLAEIFLFTNQVNTKLIDHYWEE